jgi:hypothetical protein
VDRALVPELTEKLVRRAVEPVLTLGDEDLFELAPGR